MQLSKAVDALKKGNPPSHKDTKANANKAKPATPQKSPPHTYSAIARSRPPNPSLMVDLSHLGIKLEDWVKPEVLCDAINKKLISIMLCLFCCFLMLRRRLSSNFVAEQRAGMPFLI